jgi:2-polyprenyl-3-methyl-5-hydroxy-6-metoxy-1,4-benzoquinol methylase
MENNLLLEAEAFDRQIIERVKNGHIPDLRYTEKCEYFYNNVWRHPDYVKMDFGEIFELIHATIEQYLPIKVAKVLEVGCGPGFISLELARTGYDTTGIDLSPINIKIAQEFADTDPHNKERGILKYIAGDFFSNRELESRFDAIVFVGALHHFHNQRQVLGRVTELLEKNGIVIVHEPTRDRVEKKNAAIHQMIKTLLSLSGGYYEPVPIYKSTAEIEKDVESAFNEMRYEEESGEKLQSVNDNSAGYREMVAELKDEFTQLDYQERYALFHQIIGGLRFSDQKNKELALAIKLFDKYLCDTGVIQSTEFFFAGRKK